MVWLDRASAEAQRVALNAVNPVGFNVVAYQEPVVQVIDCTSARMAALREVVLAQSPERRARMEAAGLRFHL